MRDEGETLKKDYLQRVQQEKRERAIAMNEEKKRAEDERRRKEMEKTEMTHKRTMDEITQLEEEEKRKQMRLQQLKEKEAELLERVKKAFAQEDSAHQELENALETWSISTSFHNISPFLSSHDLHLIIYVSLFELQIHDSFSGF